MNNTPGILVRLENTKQKLKKKQNRNKNPIEHNIDHSKVD